MPLDFSALDRISEHAEHDAQTIHPIQPTTITEKERAELERAAAAGLEAAKRAAAATKASEQGRTDILKGLAAGADIYALFAIACECISKTTGDSVFSAQAGEFIRDIYGRALGEKSPLKAELDAVEGRAERIKAYMERADVDQRERDNARRALDAHRREAEKLRQQINA